MSLCKDVLLGAFKYGFSLCKCGCVTVRSRKATRILLTALVEDCSICVCLSFCAINWIPQSWWSCMHENVSMHVTAWLCTVSVRFSAVVEAEERYVPVCVRVHSSS